MVCSRHVLFESLFGNRSRYMEPFLGPEFGAKRWNHFLVTLLEPDPVPKTGPPNSPIPDPKGELQTVR